MKRRVFNFLAAGSLGVGVLCLFGWVRSYLLMTYAGFPLPWDRSAEAAMVSVVSVRGEVMINYYWSEPPARARDQKGWGDAPLRGFPNDEERSMWFGEEGWRVAGFEYFLVSSPQGNGPWATTKDVRYLVMIPDYAIMGLFGVMPSWWWVRYRRKRRLRLAGCCKKCGYDLRAVPEGGVLVEKCPECGVVR